ncbi:hypothetical protein [Luteipulveratus halotolerans]|uniref:hypothetical protein n=1 Tax=Luteipulveratus halotolerans TaxID=1631356 RepID=UPI0006813637|nr:hypothetical protein [Luteipulveratus halotolerans]
MKKKLAASILAGASVAAAGGLALSSNAEAASSVRYSVTSQCKGTIIDSGYLRGGLNGQVGGGKWQLWYSPKNGGTNCVVVYDNLPGKHSMSAGLRLSGTSKGKTDAGTFNTFAGGVQATDANNRCVIMSGHVNTGRYSLATMVNKKGKVVSGVKTHCG